MPGPTGPVNGARLGVLVAVVAAVGSIIVDAGIVVAAEVRVERFASALVIAHELGHALGFMHPAAAPTGHLLHPTTPGWDDRGLEVEP